MKHTDKKTIYSIHDCRDSYGNGVIQVLDISGKLVCDCFTEYDAELIALLLRKNSVKA